MSRNLPGPRVRETILQVMAFIGDILRRAREIFWRSYRCTEEIRGQTLTARHLVRWDAGKTFAITRYDVAHKSQRSVAGVKSIPRFPRESKKKRRRTEAHIRTGNQELGERKRDERQDTHERGAWPWKPPPPASETVLSRVGGVLRVHGGCRWHPIGLGALLYRS